MNGHYTTILIGNGLGMSINPTYFSLETGLQNAWSCLNNDTQDRIKRLVTNGDALLTEQQLIEHYQIIRTCTMLHRLETKTNLNWLDENARDFPLRFQKFIEQVAWHFCDYDGDEGTLINLIKYLKYYIQHNHTHLATLNYDKLIYSSFVNDADFMNGYNGELVDGFLNDGFRPCQLNREFGRNFGWYLHLHGSPLFYTCPDSSIVKKSRLTDSKINLSEQGVREHIILCNVNLKSNLIAQSELLFTYWHYFLFALNESDKLIILGYSGNDIHVNNEITNWIKNTKSIKNKSIKIIEYADPDHNNSERQRFWATQLKTSNMYFNNQNLIQLPSILGYEFD